MWKKVDIEKIDIKKEDFKKKNTAEMMIKKLHKTNYESINVRE